MSSFIPINEIDANQSFFHPITRTEREINLLGEIQEAKPKKKSVLKAFLKLFSKLQADKTADSEIKEGFVALKIGENYEHQKKTTEAATYFTESAKHLEQTPSLKIYAENQLEELSQP